MASLPTAGDADNATAGASHPTLTDVYDALGISDTDRVSICWKHNGSGLRSKIHTRRTAPGFAEKQTGDVYFGVNPVSLDAGATGKRGTEAQVTRVVALHADLDVKDGACPDLETARQIIEDISAILHERPVHVIFSGGGLQPLWAVEACDPVAGRKLLHRFGRLVKQVAKARNANADSVFDIARILRVPGTLNHKYDPPVEVSLIADTGAPMTPQAVTEALDEVGILEMPDDGTVLGDVLSDTDTWDFAGAWCSYSKTTTDAWPTDRVGDRHPAMVCKFVRLACMWRYGCIPEKAALRATQNAIAARHTHLCATAAPVRKVGRYELHDAWDWAVDRVSRFTDERVASELGIHQHSVNVREPGESQGESDDSPCDTTEVGKKTIATRLIEMGQDTYLLGVTPEGKVFGCAKTAPHIALPLKGGKLGLRASLSREFFLKKDSAASQSALTDCCMVLEGLARQQEPRTLNIRVAGDRERIHIDMADAGNNIIEISAGTWRITNGSDHLFGRTELTKPMIDPGSTGDIELLWKYVNIEPEDRPVMLAVMVDLLISPNTSKPVTSFIAEHGSAKTSTMKCIVSLVDPSTADAHGAPRDEDRWLSQAAGSWVVPLDNLSSVPDWLSDAICRASTGDASVKRALFTDDSLWVTKIRRGVMITGIDLGGLNGDLTDRLVPIQLGEMTERLTEAELETAWAADRSAVFAGLLNLAAKVHKMLPTVGKIALPRMADYGLVLHCVDKIRDTDGMARYLEQKRIMLADSAVSDSFIAHLVDMHAKMEGTAADILLMVTPSDEMPWARPVDWPKKARTVSTRLAKHAPALRSMGWTVSNDGGQNKQKTVRWNLVPPNMTPTPSEMR
jgi:hypothetical protein